MLRLIKPYMRSRTQRRPIPFRSRSRAAIACRNASAPAPIAVNDSYTVHAGMLMSVTSNDSDPDHDNFTIQSYTWPQHGSIFKYDARTFSCSTTANGYVGSDSFTYTICDSFSNCPSPATVTVNIVNQPPVANTDNYTVHGGLLFSPKSNDTDPDGDSTTLQSIVTYPQHGNLTPWGGGSYQYAPVSGYVGSDSWTYSIKDSLGLVSIGTVNFTVANQLAAIADFYVVHTTYQMNLMENDFDPDGDSVTFQGIATQPQNGWLQGVSGGVWKYFPNSGFSGFDSFSYTIRDSLGLIMKTCES